VRQSVIRFLVTSCVVLWVPSFLICAFGGTQELMPLPKGQVRIAYTHYWDRTAPDIAAQLDDLIAM
jgi:hypothetical protein